MILMLIGYNLENGIESIRSFTDEELRKSGVPDSLINNPHYVKSSPVISNPGMFDAGFFGYTPMEAKIMDPQHRILLECASQALDHSGYDPEKFSGRIGVYTGSAMNTYFMNKILRAKFVDEYIPTLISNDKDFLSTRISYKLNLKGPSINIQTACSTSLVAVHLACQSLVSGETDMALAGAVSVKAPHEAGYLSDGGGIVSADAHVRAFDANANGTVFGSGCGIVVLKRLSDAEKDGDTIHAVIKGTAVNNDGSEKAGYTAPGVNSQADAIIEALSLADVDAESVTYIEAHGSGTPIGDPIEIAALTKAFRNFTDQKLYCAIGSVKTNIGHLDAAAGIASLIKTVLSLKNRKIPPSINFSDPNPEIDFKNSPFYVNTKLQIWDTGKPRRAGVISTGMGGTNACLILEEAPAVETSMRSDVPSLFVLSAKSVEALDQAAGNLKEFFSKNEVETDSAAYTLQTGRKAFNYRRFFISRDNNETLTILNQDASKKIFSGKLSGTSKRPVIFLFPGIGDHYVGMGYDLYTKVKVFKEDVDKCAEILNKYIDEDIRDILYPEGFIKNKPQTGSGIDFKKMLGSRVDKSADPETLKLNQTLFVQPALFTIEYSLARLWMHLGITPDAIVGHSMGEYVAACLSGVLSLEDALYLIAARAKLVNSLPSGGMIAVSLPENELTPLLNDKLSISLINSPDLCVVAGAENDVSEFEKILNEKKVLYRHVQNGHAFHSKMMDPIQDNFVEEVRKIKLNSPGIPYTSNLTGNWISAKEAADPLYWGKHSNHTARFSDALEKSWQINNCIFLELGPGNTMSVLAMKHPESKRNENPLTVSSLRPQYDNQSDLNYLLNSIGKLWLAGREIIWEKLYDYKPRRIPLPGYPFQRENYWIESAAEPVTVGKSEVLQKNSNISEWYYVPSWKRMLSIPVKPGELLQKAGSKHTWLIFADPKLGVRLSERLRKEDQEVVTIYSGSEYNYSDNSICINPGELSNYDLLIKDLREKNRLPGFIIHAWNVIDEEKSKSGDDLFKEKQESGFFSLINLTKALSKNNVQEKINLFVLSGNVQEVVGTEKLSPEKSTSLGPCMVIPQEYQNIKTKSIDIDLKEIEAETLIDQLLGEFLLNGSDTFIAYRSGQRWVQTYEQVKLGNPSDKTIFRRDGVYLITGGLGEVGYVMAKYIAQNYHSGLVLVGRTDLPDKKDWSEWISKNNSDDPLSKKINLILELESLGSEVTYFKANVADESEMRNVISRIHEKHNTLNGVIHGAGIVGKKGFSAINEIDKSKVEPHFQAKVKGLYILEKVLEGEELDFCMLMSSLTPVLGGLREVAYSSSNIFMDSFTRKHNRTGKNKWISVNWDLWRIHNSDNETLLGKTLAELGIAPEEGVKALETVLSLTGIPQIVVSTGDLNERINQWVRLDSLKDNNSENKPAPEVSGGSHLESDNEISLDQTEKTVIYIWKELLGIKEIKKNDNFFELGGHSLLAIQLISAIRKSFQIDIGLDDIFNSVTLSEMANKIAETVSAKEVLK
jgi:acyl transferase domain-containing protein/acyl carrier protein